MIVYLLYFLHINIVFSAFITDRKYDYIIVGSGSAGSVVANRLSADPCIQVLLIEAGGEPTSLQVEVPLFSEELRGTAISWNYTSVPLKHAGFGLNEKRVLLYAGKVLGGTSTINANIYTRGNKGDYDNWADMNGAVGWDYENVLHNYIKQEATGDPILASNGYHGTEGEQPVNYSPFRTEMVQAYFDSAVSLGYKIDDYNGQNQSVFDSVQATIQNGTRCSGKKSFLDPIKGRNNLHILTFAFVTKVLIDGKKKAYGVLFEQNNKEYKATAEKEIILCAGAIRSPQILMLSGIGPKEELKKFKIPVIRDLPVGKNLQDHPTTFALLFSTKTFTFRPEKITPEHFTQFLVNGTGPLTVPAAVETIGFIKCDERLQKCNNRLDYPCLEIIWRTVSPSQTAEQFVKNFNANITVAKVLASNVQGDVIQCGPYVVNPQSRGELRLASAAPYDDPIIDPNYYAHPNDIKTMVKGMEFCLKMAAQDSMRSKGVEAIYIKLPGCESFEAFSYDYLACIAKTTTVSLYHFAGTCKMGDPTDSSTVVDSRLRVKGVHYLRVVDASIMPTITSGHTHAPAAMIGEKGSEMILEDYWEHWHKKCYCKCRHI